MSSGKTTGGVFGTGSARVHVSIMPPTKPLPIDVAFALRGIASDAQCAREGGPCSRTLRALRSGHELRGDTVQKLAVVLGISRAEALTIARETAAAARLEGGQP